MIFSDPLFLVLFLPITVLAHRLALRRSEALGQWVLISSSLVFYAAWDVRWLPLLIGSILINLWFGNLLIRRKSKRLLSIAVVVNLVPLVLAKYAGWLSGGYLLSDVALPLGISFFTFQQIGFVVGAYQGEVKEIHQREYGVFVSFFPQLVAGPIVQHSTMMPQLKKPFFVDDETIKTGLILILVGLFKKVVIADNLAPYANMVFDSGGEVTLYEAWVGSLAYTFQLYFDFSGYCEMALGLALLFGLKIPINFLSPYKARSVTEFWRTWHISLGSWFKRFLYIPMGGNRKGWGRMLIALFITAFVSGIWHGAGMTFVLWGMAHGMALVIEKVWGKTAITLPDGAKLISTFLFVSLAWVLFRSPDIDTAINVYQSMIGLNGATPPLLLSEVLNLDTEILISVTGFEILWLSGLIWWVWTQPNVHEMEWRFRGREMVGATVATAAVVLSIGSPAEFLYFDF